MLFIPYTSIGNIIFFIIPCKWYFILHCIKKSRYKRAGFFKYYFTILLFYKCNRFGLSLCSDAGDAVHACRQISHCNFELIAACN